MSKEDIFGTELTAQFICETLSSQTATLRNWKTVGFWHLFFFSLL